MNTDIKREKFAHLIRKPINRTERRLAVKERSLIDRRLGRVETSFYNTIFSETNECPYIYIYDVHKDMYQTTLDEISHKLMFFRTNDKYFINQYRPEL